MIHQKWTRDQLVKVLSLYCQLPFGRMHSRNPAVVSLAQAIERTPSAVALKLVNFASFDPDLQARGVGGMANASTADRDIWGEFFGKWDVLAANSLAEQPAVIGASSHEEWETSPPIGPTEVIRESRQRRGQAFFRTSVMAAHDGKCCITGITSEPLLRASHIVPWSRDPSMRLNPRNGLCLNALHDAAFDRGLITLSDQFRLQLSDRLRTEVPTAVYREMFESRANVQITMPERFQPEPEMLEFHRREIFLG